MSDTLRMSDAIKERIANAEDHLLTAFMHLSRPGGLHDAYMSLGMAAKECEAGATLAALGRADVLRVPRARCADPPPLPLHITPAHHRPGHHRGMR